VLVYGDAEREVAPAACLEEIRVLLTEAAAAAGIERHGLLVAALIEAGALAQGIADQGFEARGQVDEVTPVGEAAMSLAVAIAEEVVASWRTGFQVSPAGAGISAALTDLAGQELPGRVTTRQPEGFAHYAVYPEAYAALASTFKCAEALLVIGLRSVGTTLAAIVAAGAGPRAVPLTLRPKGHPFQRKIEIGPALASALGRSRDACVVVVDEGPGLSGSSFAAAIRLAENLGVPPSRIHALPSHPGEPGPESTPEVRAVWARTHRHTLTFDELVLNAPEAAHRLESWCRDLIGDPLETMQEISGGAWRGLRPGWEAAPVHASAERRKFLLRTASGTWLLRFAGLGLEGLRKLEIARILAEGGFVPPPAGCRHGFLIERWIEEAAPLDPARDRRVLLDRLAAYLAYRAVSLPPPLRRGADAPALHTMVLRNTTLALGDDAGKELRRWEPLLDKLERARRPIAMDGRLHAWEWLRTGSGLLKTDGVDHHCSHDLIGPQDVAWDLAGAAVEFELDAQERACLADRIAAATGRAVDDRLVAFLLPSYAAFQLGAWTLAAAGAGEAERPRLESEMERYRRLLAYSLFPDDQSRAWPLLLPKLAC
jgi:hypothetical protein